ncbi:MAG: chromosomal replication initiator protein DnaA [Caldilineaceae bacterium]|nr:chromosomal replication initiator protein DnaA [Caldilineaceae bacterium]
MAGNLTGDSAAAVTLDERTGREAQAEFDPHAVWQMVLGELALQMPSATFDTWVRDTVVIGYEDGEFIIGMPNAYARDWLENRLRHSIKRTLGSIMRRSVQMQFRVCPRPVQDKRQVETAPLYQPDVPAAKPRETQATPLQAAPLTGQFRGSKQITVMDEQDDHFSSQLNPSHTFETFVVGNHNRLAHAAALAIVDSPGQAFNPLFIYGGVGLGKTHLLNAIGNSLRQKGYRLIYCSSEQFTNELISAIRNQNTEQFRNKYRQADVLLIDDIQFIGGKESTQEEFFHTFNHLHAAGRQVVLSSDRPPKALATLEERLRSRFEGGLQTDIAQPDFETRVAILQSKGNRMGVNIPYEVLMLVAERVDSNIRELEGALNRIYMQARLTNQAVNLQFARGLLENLVPQRVPCTPVGVIRIVAQHFNLRSEDLTGRERTKDVANARQIAMYLLRKENGLSLPAIGEQLGGRDHSTVRYGVEQVAKELERDEALRMTLMALREKVYAPAA